jgi:FMN phosphatase YigB (HAD superfamily)
LKRASQHFGFDLMETLIMPPSKTTIFDWLENQNYSLSNFQKELFSLGFPYAPLVTNTGQFVSLKNRMLISKESIYEGNYDKKKLSIINDFIQFYSEKLLFTGEKIITKLVDNNKTTSIISNLYPDYKFILNKYDLSNSVHQVILSCDISMIKPSKEIFSKVFTKVSENYYIGDNFLSDISGLKSLNTKVCPIYYCKDKLIHYVKNKGFNELIECSFGDSYKINKKAFERFCAKCIISSNENQTINKNKFISRDGTLFLENIDEIKVINNLIEVSELMEG